MTDDAAMQSRAVAIDAVAREIIRVVGEVLLAHGSDPQANVVAAAGIARALDAMDAADPMIKKIVRGMLNR